MIRSSFLNYLKHEKRYSEHTLTAYEGDLSQFSKYLEDEYDSGELLKVQRFHIRSWIYYLMEAGINPRSVQRKLSTLKSFYKYLQRTDKLESNPTEGLVAPKAAKNLPTYFTLQTLRRLIDLLPEPENFERARDRIIILLLYGCGIRRSELVNLKTEDLRLGQGHILVKGKGNKERLVPLNRELADELYVYLDLRKQGPASSLDVLLFTDRGKPLYPKYVYNVCKKYLSAVSSAEKRSPHTLRHSFATHMLDEGADLNAIKELLGHANLSATQIYTHTSIEKLRSVYRLAHPSAREQEDG